ncbi:MAG: serine/threonine-protein kinase, partial [Acidobacteriota bacterium]
MDRELWRRVAELFDEAVELPPAERDRFLDRVCTGAPALRREVERLLAVDAAPPAPFEENLDRIQKLARSASEHLAPEPPGGNGVATEPSGTTSRVGPYRLEQVLGEGGMGTVYLAHRDDDAYRRRVAVKVIRSDLVGLVHGEQALRRFRTERQILASLEHPNIARLYDGGADASGRPYLVMEHVEGEAITHYCDRHELGLDARISLFRQVADAVGHAHGRGLVHRDLKPNNVLVTEGGTPKLLDFGIAKPLDPTAWASRTTRSVTLHATTATGRRPLTPAYASPEQLRGEAISPASDVFALGVLLYELLTGVHPFAPAERSELEIPRAICEEDPTPPSRAVPTGSPALRPWSRTRLGGDLDTIVRTALHKEPERRYASAVELSDDLRRHLAELPIHARPDTLAYRTGKFLRRHRWGVAAAVALATMAALLGASLARHASE